MTWATPEDARRFWADAVDMEDEDLTMLLEAAHDQCAAYAPAIADDATVPDSWVYAEVLQARALSRSGVAGRDDQVGPDGYQVTVFPMDWTVKKLLRPDKGRYQLR
ncbi:hypothetical protein GCM10023221_04300 [Luteimicrobium xylanilyticum]|uniref:Head-to-tail adaptor n=1 Tax=Luteimicrobium xylanilyticum TaxID=1133546 RepID=A0A5P9Q774_9MICO|nr:hypothetical protein [Luteimicrobium xylanilyticum]QFU97277.1 hypothetical protein KDY119_00771 [Luteimicrobium xylanilyticum]